MAVLPAVALGGGVLCDYATLAARAARLAGALKAAGLARGERVALVSRNCLRTSRRCSAAGGRASSRFLSTRSSIRRSLPTCWRTAARAGRSSTPRGTRRLAAATAGSPLIASSSSARPNTRGCSRVRRHRPGVVRRRRSGVALLHQRHDRPAEGRRDLARQPAGDEPMLPRLSSRRSRRETRCCIRHRCRTARASTSCRMWRRARSTSCRNRAASTLTRSAALLGAWDRACFFAAPTMVKRLVARARARRRAARPAEVHRLWRRADVRRRLPRPHLPRSARGWRRSTARANRR